MARTLTGYEQETIIVFNKEVKIFYISTSEHKWQKDLEKKLGLKPVTDNGYGGREYQLDKKLMKPPRAPRRLSNSAKKELAERLHGNRVLSAQNLVPVGR